MELELSDVSVRRGSVEIVSGVSVSLAGGDALLLRGPNGSGKTSLIRTIAGLLPLGSGRIRLTPEDDRPLAERTHHIGHANAVNAALSVKETLQFWADFLGGSTESGSVDAAIEAFALGPLATFPAGLLSAGQKRRVGLARLLVA
ncbi:MAG: ATP-binding cassette domain-containing protein, partial [Pseudomonadota bacterium]